ncbi:hypothetical protein [Streptomyces sp. NPDC048419]|uniref:hypothetical protein n=1 Tax=Streptomyces sp. NPDC048419 TaxID=3365547 RepID=UPI003711729B
MPAGDHPAHLDPAPIGRWSSTPFELGVMESSQLEPRDDGTGSTTIANLAGDETSHITWNCPTAGVLELRDEHGGATRVRYTLAPVRPVGGGEPVRAAAFEPSLLCAHQYAHTGYPT